MDSKPTWKTHVVNFALTALQVLAVILMAAFVIGIAHTLITDLGRPSSDDGGCSWQYDTDC